MTLNGTTLGEKLFELRRQGKKSIQNVADDTTIDRNVIWRAENNKRVPHKHQLEILAEYYNVPLEDLVTSAIPVKEHKRRVDAQQKLNEACLEYIESLPTEDVIRKRLEHDGFTESDVDTIMSLVKRLKE